MACKVVQSLCHVPSSIPYHNPLKPPEEAPEHFFADGQQPNKAMPRLDVTEVGSEEMDICYEDMPLLDLLQVRSEEMDYGHQVPDHDGLRKDEIPCVGMRFEQLQMAHEFYVTYVKKVRFATKIRTTTCDKITNQPINQAIHYNRDGFCVSRVKASTRKNRISAAGCKAMIYVKFDKETQDWFFFKVELSHSHPCSARKTVHYHEYRKLTMHAKCVIKDNDEAGIRPNKTFLVLANESGGPSNLGYSEKDLRNFIIARLRTSNVNVDVREMMNYFIRMKGINPNFFYVVNLDDECKFRSAVWVDARCRASYEYYGDVVSLDSTYSTNKHGLSFASFVGVNHHVGFLPMGQVHGNCSTADHYDQCKSISRAIKNVLPDTRHRWCIWHITKKLPHKFGGYRRYRELYDEFNDIVWNSRTEKSFEDNWVYKVPNQYVLPRWSKNIKRKHTYVKSSHDVSRSDESHVTFRGLCAHFYNIAQDFVNNDEETALLHAALEETRAKLIAHRVKKRSETVADSHNNSGSISSNVADVMDIQAPSKVVCPKSTQDVRFDGVVGLADPEQWKRLVSWGKHIGFKFLCS
ncbi:protein FAR1-RELATED SEQUENCE 6-like [Arachis hypogaea]|uniref:protein FAR1-RELATED SEQUENCE 6-like n=1 Tax=Arachis hypogaea TaxID=3818 RepID=UPI003B212CFA